MTRRTLRRYPALGFLAVAALLASLLPSALRVPLSGPSASAELAPVPGKSDSAQGDLSALGETSTGGLGSGGGLGGLGGGGRNGEGTRRPNDDGSGGGPPDGGSGRNPAQKRCVGKPPRQTEDPLSPPCVAYFKGDNGGATAKGVTADEIVVVNMENTDSTSCQADTVYSDYDDRDDPNVDPIVAAYVAYFNERFQTYGRRVHMYGARWPCNMKADAFAADIEERLHLFYARTYHGEDFALALARRDIISALEGPKRALTVRRPPFVLSYKPDLDDRIDSAAEFLCARLAGRPARFATDPTLRDRTRKFGLVYDDYQDRQNEGAGWFLDRVRARCEDAAGEVVVGYVNGGDDDDSGITRMRLAGVTTVVVMSENGDIPHVAAGTGWHPEWYIPDQRGRVGDNLRGRQEPATEWRGAFGFSSMRRLGPPAEQVHRTAFAEGCGCADSAPIGSIGIYEDLFLLFSGIQAAGPRLTPANLDKGLHALPARQSLDPFRPAAYFAPGNYSFVKDWAAVWWDPKGTPPGTSIPGCWRLVEDGRRYRAGDWAAGPQGDDGIQGSGQPCQADLE